MLNIYNSNPPDLWEKRQDALISELTLQPLVVLIRIPKKNLDNLYIEPLISLITRLKSSGIKNIEIAWLEHENWFFFIKQLTKEFGDYSFGLASVVNSTPIEIFNDLKFAYAMSAYWDPDLQVKARRKGQIIVPGLSTNKDIKEAIQFGYRIIKIFPASFLGLNYINQLRDSYKELPFTIAAGGIKIIEINQWLRYGYNAVIIGKNLFNGNKIDPLLLKWVDNKNPKNNQ